MPIPLVVLLLLFCIVMLRNRKLVRSILSVAVVILIFCSSSVGSNLLTAQLENQYQVNNKSIAPGCLIMVLGSDHDDAVQGMATQKLSATALARLSEGVRQYHRGEDCILVVSGWGGSDSKVSHAQLLSAAAMELGIPKDRIITFPLAKDTIEEAQYLKWEVGDVPFRLVTSSTHMPRAMAIFQSQGLSPEAAPTDFISRKGHWWRLDANNLLSSQRAMHEYVGRLWFTLKYESD
ncbi:YdcF family protein [Shewanella sp. YLB-09]|nr:YdcF family protein [Shewanella sp. YLB-09]